MITQIIAQNTSDVKPLADRVQVIDENICNEKDNYQTDMINALRKLGLSGSEVFTYAHLKSIARDKNFLFASHETIAKELEISERTLSRHKARLVKFGLIVLKERWKQNLTTLIIIKELKILAQTHAKPVANVPEIATNVVTDNNDLRENDKNGLMNLKALKHDDDDGTHSFFAINDICGYYEFTTTTTWGNFEVSQTPLLEPIVAKDDEIQPLVIIQATPLGQGETVETAAPIVASLPVVEPAAPPQADAPLSPDMAAKIALLNKLPLNPGPIRQKLLDVLPKLPEGYIRKCIQFHETEIELKKSNYHNPLGFMISCMLDPLQPVPANTAVTEAKEKAASATAKRPGQARPAKKSPIVTRSYTYNANVLGK